MWDSGSVLTCFSAFPKLSPLSIRASPLNPPSHNCGLTVSVHVKAVGSPVCAGVPSRESTGSRSWGPVDSISKPVCGNLPARLLLALPPQSGSDHEPTSQAAVKREAR